MANYYCTTRTNYFRVTDEDRYKELFSHLVSEDKIHDLTYQDEKGNTWHGFGSYASIEYKTSDKDYDFDIFTRELQKILPQDDAFIIFESGYEGLNYVVGTAFIVTRDNTKSLDMMSMAMQEASEMLGRDDWTTKCEY